MDQHSTIPQRASRQGVDWYRALAFLARERQSFAERNPASAALAAQASEHLLLACRCTG